MSEQTSEAVGKGTDICARCETAKEPTRRGSANCRECDKSTRKVRRFRLTLSVPEGTWDRLTRAGKERDKSPYQMALLVLNEWARDGASPSTEPAEDREAARVKSAVKKSSLTDEQLERARRWIASTERTVPPDLTTRRQLRAWLEAEGFRP